jgi:hypothetical protein
VVTDSLRNLAAGLNQAGVRNEPVEPLRYRTTADQGYELWHGELRVLGVDSGGRNVRLLAPAASLPFKMFDYVSDVAPKVMFLQGNTVLHGSGCQRDATLLGMCGKSGAGKTTTARAFGRHGSPMISADLLVLTRDRDKPGVVIGAEARVNEWSVQASLQLAAGASIVSADALLEATVGPSIPLDALWFLDVSRRGARFEVKQLRKTEALALLMTHVFLGAADRSNWRRYLATIHGVVSAATPYEVDLPEGLDQLDQAIERYNTNSAS